jgi:hypothetical protein
VVNFHAELMAPYVREGRGELKLPGLSLDKESHTYRINGNVLSGVTGKISKRLRKNFNNDFVDEGRGQGSHVHMAIEEYIKTGREVSAHPAACWATAQLRFIEESGTTLFSEVLITDYTKYASAIDILSVDKEGLLSLFDTKAGNFDREYVSWQLGIYKLFFETLTNKCVYRCYCMSTKDKDFYPIIPRGKADVLSLLYGR